MDSVLLMKFDHPLEEVRIRAVDTLLFKLRTGKLTYGEISREGQLIQRLTEMLEDPLLMQQYSNILHILLQVCTRPFVQDKLVQHGGVFKLCQLAQSSDETISKLCKQILSEIRNGPTASVSNSPLNQLATPLQRSCSHKSQNTRLLPKEQHFTSPENIKLQSVPYSNSVKFDVSIRPVPFLPNIVCSFERVHLSLLDLEAIERFSALVVGPLDDYDLEMKLFDIICMDFGSQAFLQQPHVLRLILSGMELSYSGRPEQSLVYLKRIAIAWGTLFRTFISSPVSTELVTPACATPNISVDGTIFHSVPDIISEDYAISLPFACHEILVHLSPYLRPNSYTNSILQILEHVLPFIKFHVETVVFKTALDLQPFTFEDAAMFYFAQLASQVKHFSINPTHPDHTIGMFKYQVMLLAVQVFCSVCQLCVNTNSAISRMIQFALMENSMPFFVTELSLYQFKTPSPDAFAFLDWLMNTSPHDPAISTIIPHIHALVDKDPRFQTVKVLDHIAFILACNLADDSLECFNLLGDACIDRLLNALSPKDLVSHCFVLQALPSFSAAIATKVIEECKTVWSPHELCLFLIRGLFHRDENINSVSLATFNSSLSISITNAFVSSHLSETVLDEPLESGVSTPKVSLPDLLKKLSIAVESNTLQVGLSAEVLAYKRQNLVTTLVSEAEIGLFNYVAKICTTFDHLSEEDLCGFVSVLRMFCETSSKARESMRCTYFDFIFGLFKEIDSASLTFKLDFARLCFAVSFSDLDKSIYPTNSLQSKAISSRHQLLPVPQGIYKRFHVFGPTRHFLKSNEDFLSHSTQEKIWLYLNNLQFGSLSSSNLPRNAISMFVKQYLTALTDASAHEAFCGSLEHLALVATLKTTKSYIEGSSVYQHISRFLTTMPRSAEDHLLLVCVVKFIRECDYFYIDHLQVYLASIKQVLFPLLQRHIDAVDLSGCESYPSSHCAIASSEILAFLSWLFTKLPLCELSKLSEATPCIVILKNYTHQLFASESGKAKNHMERINCFSVLLSLVSLPNLTISIGSTDVIAEMIHLFVQVLGFSQQNYMNFSNGNTFTYKDRVIYRCAALCLRTLSRSGLDVQRHTLFLGDHWLFDGDIDWLINLLHDDEKIMQKYGLGILGNFILIGGGLSYIEAKIPQFLNMAFSFVFDQEQHAAKRKESLVIINNYIVATFQGLQSKASVETRVLDVVHDEVKLLELKFVNILDKFGLFEHFGDLFHHHSNTPYIAALAELLMNLSVLLPGYVGHRLSSASYWSVLMEHTLMDRRFFGQPIPSALNITDSDNSIRNCPYSSLQIFEHAQWRQTHHCLALSAVQNVLETIRFLTYDNASLKNMLIGQTDILMYICQTIGDLWGLAMQYQHCPIFAALDLDQWANTLLTAFSLFADLLSDLSIHSPDALSRIFTHTDIGKHLVQLVALSLDMTHPIAHRYGCILISRLLTLHYGELVKLDLDKIFETMPDFNIDHNGLLEFCYRVKTPQVYDPKDLEQDTVGARIYRSLISHFLDYQDIPDAVLLESIRLSLQCLLGRCEFSKSMAISGQLTRTLNQRLGRVLQKTVKGKLDNADQENLYACISLLRHLFAGSTAGKLSGVENRVTVTISQIISLQDIHERLLLECFGCLRNLITKCDSAKRLVLDWKQYKKPCISILDSIRRMYQDSSQSSQVFCTIMEVLKLLVLEKTTRATLFKININAELLLVLERLFQNKETTRSRAIIGYFINATYTTDGQLAIMRIDGLLPVLTNFLGSKSTDVCESVLPLLINLSLARENKIHILANENMICILRQICTSDSLRLIAKATTLVRVLLCKSEKAKFSLKQSSFGITATELQDRLCTKYPGYISKMTKEASNGNELHIANNFTGALPEEEKRLLSEALNNAVYISRHLQSYSRKAGH
ncbi:hypothetical protein BDV3_007142 [Batrachochytrium dendrobatidis]